MANHGWTNHDEIEETGSNQSSIKRDTSIKEKSKKHTSANQEINVQCTFNVHD